LVTSHEAGMSVPNWPNSFDYNMFLFPPSKWIGGIFYEHTHRLIASGVGLMTTILAVWLWLKDSRRWMHWIGQRLFSLSWHRAFWVACAWFWPTPNSASFTRSSGSCFSS
ncbi:MAG TPA: hypothetical protein VKS19_08010, partial [Verrucomicrobiae bacterium]|nr:hypothetical protein [Verrucomicrobiae bacterium]